MTPDIVSQWGTSLVIIVFDLFLVVLMLGITLIFVGWVASAALYLADDVITKMEELKNKYQ